MSESLLAAKRVEAAKKRKGGSSGESDDAFVAARAILTAIKGGSERALARALRSFAEISSPPADDEAD